MEEGASIGSTGSEVPPWFPAGLTDQACEPSAFANGLPSPWGRFYGWDWRTATSPTWWNQPSNTTWGDWPSEVTKVDVLEHTRHSVIVDLDGRFIAHLFPFQTGHDVSTLALFQPWREALSSAPLLMPVGGMKDERGDMAIIYPHHDHEPVQSHQAQPLADALGRLHKPLVAFATPNTERRWNERLKSIEGHLKTTTLWRAPHTRNVLGLPTVYPTMLVKASDAVQFIPAPRPLMDHLLCEDERLPGAAMMGRLEQRLALVGRFESSDERQDFYEAWAQHLPASWSSPSSISTVNGGLWIWRYEAILLMLAEARAYGLEEQVKQCEGWLNDVSRIQARLGELRSMHGLRKTGLWGALATVLITWDAQNWSGLPGAVIVTLLTMAGIGHVLYRRRLPSPY